MADAQHPQPTHPRDISAEDLAFALATQSDPALLSKLVELSRDAFGFFPSLYPHTINYPWAVERLRSLAARSRILDVGAGVSPVPLFLAGQGLLVDCVDNSQHVRTLPLAANCNEWGFLDYALLHPNLTSHHCDITEFTPSTTYDAVYAIASLAHMTRAIREETLRRAHAWLRPGGLLLLTIDVIPASDFIWNRTEGREVEPPIRHGTIQGVTDHLVGLGFNLGEVRVTRSVHKSRTDLLFIAAHRAA